MKAKIDRLEQATDGHDTKYVTYKHFQAVVTPLQSAITEMQRDIKRVLVILTSGRRWGEHVED